MLGWVLSGFSVGPQRVLSEYSGYSWVLKLFIFEHSGGSQAGTSPQSSLKQHSLPLSAHFLNVVFLNAVNLNLPVVYACPFCTDIAH